MLGKIKFQSIIINLSYWRICQIILLIIIINNIKLSINTNFLKYKIVC